MLRKPPLLKVSGVRQQIKGNLKKLLRILLNLDTYYQFVRAYFYLKLKRTLKFTMQTPIKQNLFMTISPFLFQKEEGRTVGKFTLGPDDSSVLIS